MSSMQNQDLIIQLLQWAQKVVINGLNVIENIQSHLWTTNFIDVVDIQKGAKHKVYDIEVEDNHNFLANGLLVHNCSRQSMSAFLEPLESAVSTTTVILVSMDEGRLDSTVREAIESRAVEIKLPFHPQEVISKKLVEGMDNKLDVKAADIIAFIAKGNMRKAWSTLQYFLTIHPNAEDITEEIVAKYKLSGAGTTAREELWNAVRQGNTTLIKSYIDEWKRQINEETICQLLIEDLSLNDLTEQGLECLSQLSVWFHAQHRIPLITILILNRGHQIKIPRPVPIEQEEIITRTELDKLTNEVEESLVKKEKVQVLPAKKSVITIQDIKEFAENKLGNTLTEVELPESPVPIPIIFQLKQFSQIVEAYS